jgi:hypothetical protein
MADRNLREAGMNPEVINRLMATLDPKNNERRISLAKGRSEARERARAEDKARREQKLGEHSG